MWTNLWVRLNTKVDFLRKLSLVLTNAFWNLVPTATYTMKLAEELMESAKWEMFTILWIQGGRSSQHWGGDLERKTKVFYIFGTFNINLFFLLVAA